MQKRIIVYLIMQKDLLTFPKCWWLKIKLTLSKRPLLDTGDADFIELMRTDEGKLKKLITKVIIIKFVIILQEELLMNLRL